MGDELLGRMTQQIRDNVQRLKDAVSSNDAEGSEHPIQKVDRDRDFQDDADIVSNAIMDQFSPDSVIQIGCGIGMHLKSFLEQGVDAVGIDENRVAHENAVVSTKHIQIQSLNQAYTPDDTYDVVLCIDMLEYTSRNHEDALIETVADAGAIAVVSVPLPRYSSLSYNHEEPKQYWVQKFKEHGLSYDPDETRHLQDRIDAAEEAWVPEQLMVFRKNG